MRVKDYEGKTIAVFGAVQPEYSCIIPTTRKNRREDLLDENMEHWKQWY